MSKPKRKMYAVKDVYKTFQGEGRWTGRRAVFVRFSGCNLACPWCDTDFTGRAKYTLDGLCSRINTVNNADGKPPADMIVFTGGEPALQLDVRLVQTLQYWGFYTAIETNGTISVGSLLLNWICCSPKPNEGNNAKVVVSQCNELKYVIKMGDPIPKVPPGIQVDDGYLLSPMTDHTKEGRDAIIWENIDWVLHLVEQNPKWRISLQMHKFWSVP